MIDNIVQVTTSRMNTQFELDMVIILIVYVLSSIYSSQAILFDRGGMSS